MLALLFLFQSLEPPTTVNGQVLGSLEEFQTLGPARVCLSNASFDLLEGEEAYLEYSGIHNARINIISNGVRYHFFMSDGGPTFSGESRLLWTDPYHQLWETVRDGRAIYSFVGNYDSELEGVYFGSLQISSEAFSAATEEDRYAADPNWSFLDRVTIFKTDADDCERHYRFGWPVLFGDEPLSARDEAEAEHEQE